MVALADKDVAHLAELQRLNYVPTLSRILARHLLTTIPCHCLRPDLLLLHHKRLRLTLILIADWIAYHSLLRHLLQLDRNAKVDLVLHHRVPPSRHHHRH